ncbi:MAG: acriflavin resistance protein [Rhodospirillaceae bacterium]|nr:acriflavin resistance protein [Rhodospirillaceae bacterium]
MKFIELAVKRPVAVLSVVLMVVLMGFLALKVIPIQLTPDVRKPLLIIQTKWPGASPAEVEKEIVIPQEERLKGLEGLERMESRSRRGRSQITLEFNVNTDRNQSILLVNNRLQQVTGLPEEADEPVLKTRDTDDNPIAWFTVETRPGNSRPIRSYGDFVDDIVRDRLERVNGVALVNVYGGNESEIRVIVDPKRLAHFRMTITELNNALRGTNINLSAGEVDEGKRQYTVRTQSELNTVKRVKEVVLRAKIDPATGRIFRVRVGDVASVEFGHKKRDARIRNRGKNAIVVSTIRDTGANVIETMKGIRRVVEELNREIMPEAGLIINQVRDDTVYINYAINLVTQNIWLGGSLAAIILFLFLRSFGATAVVTLAIPVSVIGSFVALAALGRSINVISLAGIAFAVGMVVDAAIVVLENIYRHRERGESKLDGALKGAGEVWGAIMASALTTVVVFAPILVMNLVVGQLFRDIAVALSVAVLLSLIVSITVVPALANKFLGDNTQNLINRRRIPILDSFASGFSILIFNFTKIVIQNRALGALVIICICGFAGLGTWAFLPKLSYLPSGNQNFILAIANPPPGYNLKTLNDMATKTENMTRRYWAKSGEKPKKCAPWYARIEIFPPKIKECDIGDVRMERFWFVTRSTSTFMGTSATDPTRAKELIPIMRRAVFSEPGTFGFAKQRALFGRGFGGSEIIDLDITGPNLETLLSLAREGVEILRQEFPAARIRPKPGLELGAPEVRLVPNLLRLADVGLTARDLGLSVDVFNDGLRVTEVTRGSKRIDLTLRGLTDKITSTQGIGNLPVVTRTGQILPASSLAKLDVTEGPTQIRHLERIRTVTLQIRPPENIALETAIQRVRENVILPMVKQGLPSGVRLTMSGTADELNKTWNAMLWNLLIAVAVVYLVLAILFESFVFPILIMFSVPLATAGGVAGLSILNIYTFQALDMLTLLGFVILVGTVVNNAILLVHQTLYHVRVQAMNANEAIAEATRNRIRPIFMSTLTSVFGMLPLVVMPGAGSELYRGLGSVVLGGLALSAVLTLLIIPPLLSFVAPILRRQQGILANETTRPLAAKH